MARPYSQIPTPGSDTEPEGILLDDPILPACAMCGMWFSLTEAAAWTSSPSIPSQAFPVTLTGAPLAFLPHSFSYYVPNAKLISANVHVTS